MLTTKTLPQVEARNEVTLIYLFIYFVFDDTTSDQRRRWGPTARGSLDNSNRQPQQKEIAHPPQEGENVAGYPALDTTLPWESHD
eukprot:gene8147-5679_t